MDAVKGTAVIGFLGDLYEAGIDPGATGVGVAKTAAKKGLMRWNEYEEQIKDLKNADIGWRTGMNMGAGVAVIFQAMTYDQEISPSDLLG